MTNIIPIWRFWAASGGIKYVTETGFKGGLEALESSALGEMGLDTRISQRASHINVSRDINLSESNYMKILVACDNGHSEVLVIKDDLNLDLIKLIDGTSSLFERRHDRQAFSIVGKCGLCWSPFKVTIVKGPNLPPDISPDSANENTGDKDDTKGQE